MVKCIWRTVGAFSLALISGVASAQNNTPGRWNVKDHLKPEEVIVQSHRGAGDLAPENTIEAFELGWKLGTYPESDVRTTTDGVIVAFHDANFKRVVKNVAPELASKGVKDLTWAELQKLDVGSWKGENFSGHRVRMMEEIFAEMKGHPDRHLYLDIKDVDLKKLSELVNKHGVGPQVVLASPKHEQIIEWKKYVPKSDTLLWIGGKTQAEQTKKFNDAREKGFEGITQVQMHTYFKDDKTSVTRDSANPFSNSDVFLLNCGLELRKHGILYQTLPWGGSYEGVYWKLLDLGFMSFATDHPDTTRKAIVDYYKLPDTPKSK